MVQILCLVALIHFLSCRREPLPVTRWNFSKLTPAWPWSPHALTTWQSCDHRYIYGNVFSSLHHTAAYHNLSYISGLSYVGEANSYQKSTWSLGDNYIKEYNDWFLEQQTQFLLGRYGSVLTHLRHIKSIYSSFVPKYPLNPSELKIDEIEQFRVGSFFNGICKKTVDVFTM